jgi:hypothetical protein
MNTTLSDEQLATFREDGYLVVRNAFDPELGRECAQRVLEALEREQKVDLNAPSKARYVLGRRSGEPFDGLATPRLLSVMDALLGADAWDRRHMTSHGAFFVTFPGFHGAVWKAPIGVGRWHIDLGYETIDAFHLKQGNCALVPVLLLTPSRVDGAATLAVRGSHRLVARMLRRAHWPVKRWQAVAFCEALMMQPSWQSKIVQLVGEAGDVVFLHPHVIHCASANVTSHVRIMCNTGVGLIGDRLWDAPMPPSEVDELIKAAVADIEPSVRSALKLRACLLLNYGLWKMRYAVHGNLPDTVDKPATPWRGQIEKMIRPVSASLAAAIADPAPSRAEMT